MENSESGLRAEAVRWDHLLALVSGRGPLAFAEPLKDPQSLGPQNAPCLQPHEVGGPSSAEAPLDEMLIIIVPYRSRPRHLRLMLNEVSGYLNSLLQHQESEEREQQEQQQQQQQREGWPRGRTGYCFLVTEQRDSRPFHRGLLLNAASLWAASQFPDASDSSLDSCNSGPHKAKTTTFTTCISERKEILGDSVGRGRRPAHGSALTVSRVANSWEGHLGVSGKRLAEVKVRISGARRAFICLHDVDVVPKGRRFDAQRREGQPCCYLPAPPSGVVRHLYGEPWSLSMAVCLRLEDLAKANGHDLRYEGWGFEDEDFCMRCRRAGLSVQRGPLNSVGCKDRDEAANPVGSSKQSSLCSSECCTRVFSRRLCECAPFRELDIHSKKMLRSAMVSKLCSPEGYRNQRLFRRLWLPNGEAPSGSCWDLLESRVSTNPGLNVALGHGLRETEELLKSGRLKLRVEPWPPAEAAVQKTKEAPQQHHQEVKAAKAEEIREEKEEDTLRQELLCAYGSHLVWLSVSLAAHDDGGTEGLREAGIGDLEEMQKNNDIFTLYRDKSAPQKRRGPQEAAEAKKSARQI